MTLRLIPCDMTPPGRAWHVIHWSQHITTPEAIAAHCAKQGLNPDVVYVDRGQSIWIEIKDEAEVKG